MLTAITVIICFVGTGLILAGFVWWRQKNGAPVGFQGLVGTNGEVKKLSSALISKEIQSAILIDSITDGIIVTDIDCRVNLFNKSAAGLTQWSIDEAMGLDARVILNLLADEKTGEIVSKANHPFTTVLMNREAVTSTVQVLNRQNQSSFISLAISPVILPRNNELIGTVAVFRDVSKDKSEEQQRADFVSTASHEMRTPVAAIEGYLALAMNDKVSQIDNRARDYLEKAHASTQHLGQLFQDLLTSARAEDGRLTSNPTVVEMGDFTSRLVEDLRFGAEKKGLRMEYVTNAAGSANGTVIDVRARVVQPLYYTYADADRLREVITNLFDNACKYTDEGSVSLAITGNEDVVQVRIRDTGVGIPAEDVPHSAVPDWDSSFAKRS
jgi:PAS domain S-box-containing protein